MTLESQPHLSTARNLKIGLFHLGSGMADVITTGVWNRIMISDLGFSATPIGLLIALRYFLAPLGVWAGSMSDRHSIGGYRRLFWIWLGRGLMAASIAVLGLATAHVARGAAADALIWTIISVSLLAFSLGYSLSGSTFLALIYDRSGAHQRGRAVGIVWTFLLLGFTIGGILFGVLLPDNVNPRSVLHSPLFDGAVSAEDVAEAVAESPRYSPETLQNLFLIGAAVMAGLWLFSVLGEEKRHIQAPSQQADREQASSIISDLKLAWNNRQARFFLWYLALSMMFAFTQDLILEPFAADVFNMTASTTSRFAAYWGSMAILGTIIFLILSRRYRRLTNTVMSYIGVGSLLATFVVFGVSAVAELRWLVTPGLILLGIGLGIWNVGTLGLMIDMSPHGKAGTFLGFWTLVVTFSRGLGVVGGGLLRDLGFQLTASFNWSYGAAFLIGALGLAAALWALSRVRMQATTPGGMMSSDPAKVLAGSMD